MKASSKLEILSLIQLKELRPSWKGLLGESKVRKIKKIQ